MTFTSSVHPEPVKPGETFDRLRAADWDQLSSLFRDFLYEHAEPKRARTARRASSHNARVLRIDQDLYQAGAGPQDPSLYDHPQLPEDRAQLLGPIFRGCSSSGSSKPSCASASPSSPTASRKRCPGRYPKEGRPSRPAATPSPPSRGWRSPTQPTASSSTASPPPSARSWSYSRSTPPGQSAADRRYEARKWASRSSSRGEVRADLEVEALVDILHALPIYKILTSRGDPGSIAQIPDGYMPLLMPGIPS